MLLHSVCTTNLPVTGALPRSQQAVRLRQIENIFDKAREAAAVMKPDKDSSPAFCV